MSDSSSYHEDDLRHMVNYSPSPQPSQSRAITPVANLGNPEAQQVQAEDFQAQTAPVQIQPQISGQPNLAEKLFSLFSFLYNGFSTYST